MTGGTEASGFALEPGPFPPLDDPLILVPRSVLRDLLACAWTSGWAAENPGRFARLAGAAGLVAP